MEGLLYYLDGLLGAAWYFPWLLLGVGLFFTFYLGFPQIRYFKQGGIILSVNKSQSARDEVILKGTDLKSVPGWR